MTQRTRNVTETEFAILNVLWDRGSITVREIVESIYGKHTHPLHATVKSLLERLVDKDYVVCERRGAAHRFAAIVNRETFVAEQLQQVADNNFGGSLTPVLLTLVDNVKLSPRDREAIRRIVEKMD